MLKKRNENHKQMEQDLSHLWTMIKTLVIRADILQSLKAKEYITRHAAKIWKDAAFRVIYGHGIKEYYYKPHYCRIVLMCGAKFELGVKQKEDL